MMYLVCILSNKLSVSEQLMQRVAISAAPDASPVECGDRTWLHSRDPDTRTSAVLSCGPPRVLKQNDGVHSIFISSFIFSLFIFLLSTRDPSNRDTSTGGDKLDHGREHETSGESSAQRQRAEVHSK